MTKDCVTAASTLIQSMDANINPCENFYSFACGGFIDNTNIPQDKAGVSTMSQMQVKYTNISMQYNLL
jgi:predicted metalloendopeptidase